jgi:hypothetical protein
MAVLKTVSNLRDSVAALLSGVDIDNVENLNGALERAARTLVQKADVPEASGKQNIVLYSNVYNYLCDSNIFGTAVNDIRPQGVSRLASDTVAKRPGEQFDRTKGYLPNGTMFTFEYINGAPTIRIVSQQPTQHINLDQMNAATGWAAAGSASALTQDTGVFYESPASLRFLLTGSSTGTLTKTLTNPLDMTSYEDVGVAFLAIRIPDGATASNLTSIGLRVGSNASNYDTVSSTTGFLGAWVSGDWLLVAFDFSAATSTGTPTWSAIDYVQVSLAHTGTFTNFRVGGLWMSLPSPAQILYQSAAIFKASGAAASTTITTVDDQILLNDPAYTLYEYESAISILFQTGGGSNDSTIAKFTNVLQGNGSDSFGLYGLYRGDNPSEEIRTVGSYYD